MASRPRTCLSQIPVGRSSSSSTNRLMQTRMSGGLGADRGDTVPYPDLCNRTTDLCYDQNQTYNTIAKTKRAKNAIATNGSAFDRCFAACKRWCDWRRCDSRSIHSGSSSMKPLPVGSPTTVHWICGNCATMDSQYRIASSRESNGTAVGLGRQLYLLNGGVGSNKIPVNGSQ